MSKAPFFPPKTLKLMSSLGLSELDVLDVFNRGEKSGNGLVRKYSGYEIGLFYATDKITGQPIITYVWKRERR